MFFYFKIPKQENEWRLLLYEVITWAIQNETNGRIASKGNIES